MRFQSFFWLEIGPGRRFEPTFLTQLGYEFLRARSAQHSQRRTAAPLEKNWPPIGGMRIVFHEKIGLGVVYVKNQSCRARRLMHITGRDLCDL